MTDFEGAVKSATKEANSFAGCKWRFIDALLVDERLIERDKVVGIRLVQRYIQKQNGLAYPGNELLGADLDMHPRTVERALAWLVKCDYFIQGHTAGGRGLANEYAVDWSRYGAPTKTTTAVSPFSNVKPKTTTTVSVNPDNGVVKTPTQVSPQKRKTKRDRKGTGDASPLSAYRAAEGSPSNTGSGTKDKKESRQWNGASIPKPRLGRKHRAKNPPTAAEKIEHKLITECKMERPEVWGILIDVSESEIERIAGCIGKLSGPALLTELTSTKPNHQILSFRH